jgi:hypothetical protein
VCVLGCCEQRQHTQHRRKCCAALHCRRGYDVAAFAAAGAALSVGLDLCPDAIAAAEAECATQLAGSPAAAAACQLIAGDFFTYTPPPDAAAGDGAGHGASSGAPLFDAGYDYTFLCALHPNMRQVCVRRAGDGCVAVGMRLRPRHAASRRHLLRGPPAPRCSLRARRHAPGLGGHVGAPAGARRAAGEHGLSRGRHDGRGPGPALAPDATAGHAAAHASR